MEDIYKVVGTFLAKNRTYLNYKQVRYFKQYASDIAQSKLLTQDQKKHKIESYIKREFPHLSLEEDYLKDTANSQNDLRENSYLKKELSVRDRFSENYQNVSNIFDTSFSFHKYVKNINVKDLIEKNQVFDESKSRAIPENAVCFFCKSMILAGEHIRLTDGTFLCEKCFVVLQNIKYPEKYQRSFEDFLLKREAHKLGEKEFLETLPYSRKIEKLNSISQKLSTAVTLSFILFIISFFIIPRYLFEKVLVLFTIFLTTGIINKMISKKGQGFKEEMQSEVDRWNRLNPEPEKPVIKSFYDPEAILTDFDKKVLHVFNYWPGYPPFWDYLRDRILERDNQRCQVTGCPSRTELHLHHKLPISNGGSHIPENLVMLCAFHHGLQPEPGHERIWGNIKTQYFTLVSKHVRNNRKRGGRHTVRAHLRRLELITMDDLKSLNDIYQFACPSCESLKLKFTLNKERNDIYILCKSCNKQWKGPRELAEETGPRLGEFLKVKRNQGTSKTPWEVLSKRTSNIWGEWKGKKVKDKRKLFKSGQSTLDEKPMCPVCGSIMKLVQTKPGNKWKSFWGCSKYNITGCKGTRPYNL